MGIRDRVQQVEVIKRDDMSKLVKIRVFDLPAPVAGNVDAVSCCNRLGAAVRRCPDMPMPGPGGIHLRAQANTLTLGTKGRLGQWRTADISQTDEEHGGLLHQAISAGNPPRIKSASRGRGVVAMVCGGGG